MAKIQQCADCHRTLTAYEALFHVCPQQLRANRRAQARQREREDVLRTACACGKVATECLQDGTLVCAGCHDNEVRAREDAARDCAELRNELQRGPMPPK